MPIYDYACTSCRHVVEVIHRISEPGPHFCPNCGAEGTMRKAVTTSAVHFKGTGWAKKDRSASSSAGKSRSSSAKTEAKAGQDGGTSDAAKPAPTPAPSSEGGD
ncbi:MAG TPA: zinc ribbon domain-containing protein [Candidatus Limnocylindrales bacterium]|nr:zinc ribbon domain-containing protein [Candidatus Limnocylindrales bacterium]